MEYIISLIICIVIIVILKFALNIKTGDMKELKKIGYSKELNDITDKLPNNEEVCTAILKQVKNENVKIKVSDNENLGFYCIYDDDNGSICTEI